jgi:hypothetical protein
LTGLTRKPAAKQRKSQLAHFIVNEYHDSDLWHFPLAVPLVPSHNSFGLHNSKAANIAHNSVMIGQPTSRFRDQRLHSKENNSYLLRVLFVQESQ